MSISLSPLVSKQIQLSPNFSHSPNPSFTPSTLSLRSHSRTPSKSNLLNSRNVLKVDKNANFDTLDKLEKEKTKLSMISRKSILSPRESVNLSNSIILKDRKSSIYNNSDSIKLLLSSALNGDLNSYYSLAYYYIYGPLNTLDFNLGVSYLLNIYNNHNDACNLLGKCYYLGKGVLKDYNKAYLLFEKAAIDNIDAQLNIGKCFYYGNGCNKDIYSAFNIFQNLKTFESMYWLGRCLFTGAGCIKDKKRALLLMEDAAENGIMEATLFLYFCFINGKGTAKDPKKAAIYAKILINTDDFDVICLLAKRGWPPLHYNTLFNIFSRAASAEPPLPAAQCAIGTAYYYGNGADIDKSLCVSWFKKAAASGDIEANYYLGHQFMMTQTYDKSFTHFKTAADLGHSKSLFELAEIYENGVGKEVNYKLAYRYYRDFNDTEEIDVSKTLLRFKFVNKELVYSSQIKLDLQSFFTCCFSQSDPSDYEEPENFFENMRSPSIVGAKTPSGKSVVVNKETDTKSFFVEVQIEDPVHFDELLQSNDYEKCVVIANNLRKSKIIEDFEKSFLLYKHAAAGENYEAMAGLGVCSYFGYGTPQNYALAVELLTKASLHGNEEAAYYLGLCFYYGYGVPKNFHVAVSNFEKALKYDCDAFYMLGICYYNGEGVPIELEKAVLNFQEAVDKGHINATYSLAKCYYKGEGVTKDKNQATILFQRAADSGHNDSYYYLGLCYCGGMGIEQNMAKGYDLLRRAAQNGNEQAEEFLKNNCT